VARRRTAPGLLLAALALLAGPARAATIAYLAQERFLEIEEVPSGAVQRVEAADFSAFGATLVGADGVSTVSQTSSLTATRILAAVSQDAADERNVESSFSVTFTLDEASPFVLDGVFEELDTVTDIHEFFPWNEVQIVVEASLMGPSGTVAAFEFDLQADCAFQQFCDFTSPIEATGVLGPGTYTLEARTFATLRLAEICFGFLCSNQFTVETSSDALVSLDFRLVPEPATLGAVASGLLVLAAGARRARRAGSRCAG